MQTGFNKFLHCLDSYMDLLDDSAIVLADETKINIYGSVTLENGAIMRATNSYHGRPWFSNVSVRMNSDELHDYASDQGICYGQVII